MTTWMLPQKQFQRGPWFEATMMRYKMNGRNNDNCTVVDAGMEKVDEKKEKESRAEAKEGGDTHAHITIIKTVPGKEDCLVIHNRYHQTAPKSITNGI